MNNFWQNLPKPFFILAPMEAVTDVVFRHVIMSASPPDVLMTEFVSSAGYCSSKGQQSTRGRLAFTDNEQPIVVQIWGNSPENFKIMSADMKNLGFAGIDINMGCPEKSVVKGGSGIGLCRTPELASELIKNAKASGLPVSVKTRLGDINTSDLHAWLGHILRQDIANLTVHLRTRSEMSKVDAHFELIPAIKQLRDEIAPQTLLTINGDIRDREHGLELVDKYGVDGVMIGRGVFHNPYAFEKEKREHSRDELIGLLNLQLDLHDQYSSELDLRKFDPLKRFFKIYIRDFPGASELREKLMHTKTTDEVRQILQISE
jgi:tRNA-dihydrouridine synthase